MTAVNRVAIAGGGAAGAAAAILLAQQGISVDVFESKTSLSALGSGITLQGNALRVLAQLGVWDQVSAEGYAFDVLGLRAPGPDATIIAQIPDQRTGGPEFPATMGMYRPDLARILIERAQEVGARVHFGQMVTGFIANEDGVAVSLVDNTVEHFDLLIGADGLHSRVRELMGITTAPERTGMGIWRAFVRRPASVTHTELYYGGPCYIAGYCPTSEDSMYAYLVEKAQDRSGVSDEQAVEIMRGLSQAYHGPWDEIREDLSTASRVNYTWFTQHVVPEEWNRGRVVLIGEAAHSAPPTLAQGAAQALEDAAVLSELLLDRDAVDEALWAEFHARRLARATEVVDASVQLGTWLLEENRDANIPELMGRIGALVSEPA
jgi:2-polyprenyl-6-methoxyphenol hydroxylase-like FAD-dependent oxidoreductase